MIKKLQIYVPELMLETVEKNENSFLMKVHKAFEQIGFEVSFVKATSVSLALSYRDDTYCLFFRNRPQHKNALELRPSAFGAFWMIDKTADPAEKLVYKRKFNPAKIDPQRASDFFQRMTSRFKKADSDQGGFVLIAMQGKIDRQRFWQSMTPLDMVRETISQETDRKIYIKLHPKEVYSNSELSDLKALTDGDRIQLVEGDLDKYLASCDYTVSMSSSVSMKGLLYRKPGILFGDAEFHHVFQSVRTKEVGACFKDVLADELEVEKYVFWFLKHQHLWNYSPNAHEDILKRCSLMGWEI